MPGTFIISPRPKKLGGVEQRLCLPGINESAFILEGQGRNTGRHHELHDKREVPAGLDEPCMAYVGHFMRVGGDSRRTERKNQ